MTKETTGKAQPGQDHGEPIHCDVVIVGAGPTGLFQVFELGLLDIKAHVVDSLPQVGGQCSKLYPEKPIYDIPAWPVIGAQQLIDQLLQQIEPFHATFHLGQTVAELAHTEGDRFLLTTSTGTRFDTANIIIAAGLGAFRPRQLRARGMDQLTGNDVRYSVTDPELYRDRDLLILGGGDSALDWTLELAERVRSLTLVHRRAEYRAQPASVKRMQTLRDAGQLTELQGNVREVLSNEGRLSGLELVQLDGEVRQVHGDSALVFWGLSPHLGPIADWGLDIEKRQIPVDTEQFQTSQPGIFAVGDINTYPGKKKLILSGFHEAALAAFGVQKRLHPDKRQTLQYTTTSPIMHRRLGVSGED